jgi:predicted nucleotide-binding protein
MSGKFSVFHIETLAVSGIGKIADWVKRISRFWDERKLHYWRSGSGQAPFEVARLTDDSRVRRDRFQQYARLDEADKETLVGRLQLRNQKLETSTQADNATDVVTRDPVIFIGHGRSDSWRQLKDHLGDDLRLTTEYYEKHSRVGMSITEFLKAMLDTSAYAVLVLTGEDETSDETVRARQNVIHEAGLFQGRLGFEKVALLHEMGIEEFSNNAGLQHVSFGKGRIDHAFGALDRWLRREGLIT